LLLKKPLENVAELVDNLRPPALQFSAAASGVGPDFSARVDLNDHSPEQF
jgi:hypothetical protein